MNRRYQPGRVEQLAELLGHLLNVKVTSHLQCKMQ
jgi:hypothetical protein